MEFPGAFSIFHQGHLEALKAARKRLLTRYRDVVAFISPDHDEYIKLKLGDGFGNGVYGKNVKIIHEFAFTRGSSEVEVLDARDFRKGPLNGLVINGERKPYTLPWVVPSVRCSVKNSFKFTEAMKVFLEP